MIVTAGESHKLVEYRHCLR